MLKHFYPAIFSEEKDGYSVAFPDLEGCFTEGDTLEEAYEMAKDALGLYLEQDIHFVYPPASKPNMIKTSGSDFVVILEFDEMIYRKRHNNRSVKKTLTVPSWLNEIAVKENINFSGVLQEALIKELHLNK